MGATRIGGAERRAGGRGRKLVEVDVHVETDLQAARRWVDAGVE